MDEKTDIEINEALSNVFTKEKIRIMRAINEKRLFSVGELAKCLNRDIAAVYRDLKVLEDNGLIYLKKDGKSVQPILKNKNILLTFEDGAEKKAKTENTCDYIG